MGKVINKEIRNKLILLLAVLTLLGGFSVLGAMSPAFAEGKTTAVEVYYDDTLKKSFTMDDLEQIWVSEGEKSYNYSGFNTYPSVKPVVNVEGPTLQGILVDALGSDAANQIREDQLIEFVARDPIREGYLAGQLLGERYYFPDFKNEEGRCGAAALESSKADPKAVPAVISLREDGKVYGKGSDISKSDSVGRLLFGQLSPNEQNHAAYIRYFAADNQTEAGKIIVHSEDAETWNPVTTIPEAKAGTVEIGTALNFDKSVNRFAGGTTAGRYWIYYTTDGSEPTIDSHIYNYNSNAGDSQKYNSPVAETYGKMVIRTKVLGYGKKDSEITQIELTVVPKAPAALTVKSADYQSAKLSWKGQADVDDYSIYRSTSKSSGFVKLAETDAATFKDSGLKTGTTYYYKVAAHAKAADSSDVYSSDSATVSVKPTLTKPVQKAPALKKKTITVKWKAVPGASGYQIYRAMKKSGKYKLIKTVKNGRTVSFKNKKLKKKKTYYYKIRAYRTVAGKKVYSSFSAVKYKKVK